MLETYMEFTFEAAHEVQPFSSLHGHTFKVTVFLTGEADPVYGWTHNLYDVEEVVGELKKTLDHKYLNDIEGLEVPSLENVARWIWTRLNTAIPGLDRVSIRRGPDGGGEGCTFRGEQARVAA